MRKKDYNMNGLMVKVSPTDINTLFHVRAIARDRSESRMPIRIDTFLECRDNVYMYIDKCYDGMEYPIPDGIIACRRTTIEEIDVTALKFYSVPHYILYSIEVFDIIQCTGEDKKYIARELLKTVAADKNDAFIAIKFFDRYGNILTDDIKDVLAECNYDFFSYKECMYTYVKHPTMLINKDQ